MKDERSQAFGRNDASQDGQDRASAELERPEFGTSERTIRLGKPACRSLSRRRDPQARPARTRHSRRPRYRTRWGGMSIHDDRRTAFADRREATVDSREATGIHRADRLALPRVGPSCARSDQRLDAKHPDRKRAAPAARARSKVQPGTPGPTLTGQVSASMDGRSTDRPQDLADPADPAQPEPPKLPPHPTIIRSAVTAKAHTGA